MKIFPSKSWAVLCCLLITFFTFSCEKSIPEIQKDLTPAASGIGEFADITVSNGYLQFTSDQHVIDVLDALHQLETTLESYLNDLYGTNFPDDARLKAMTETDGPFEGLNPITGSAIGTLEYNEQDMLNDDPIRFVFEEAFNYKSLRRHLAETEISLLNSDEFDGDGNDPEDHFIEDDDLRMLLNDELEWEVAGKYYRIVSATSILEVQDISTTHLGEIRDEFVPATIFTEIPDLPTPGICYANPAVQNYANATVIDFMEPQAPLACVALFAFSYDPILLTTVDFTNLSSGTYTSVVWDFGDGGSSTQASPTHTYSQNGTYTVTLTLWDGPNSCDAFSDVVTISSSCVADFSASDLGGGTVSFSDYSASNNTSATVTNWLWDFGDGSSSTSANPTHTFANSGDYNVCLTITTSDNCVEQFCDMVSVTIGCCKTNKSNRDGSGSAPVPVGNNRGYKGKVWITSIPGYRRAGSKTVCYRQKNNGNWVKERADYIYTGSGGNVYDTDCTQSTGFSISDDKTSAKKVSETYPFGYSIRTQQNQIGGTYEFDDNGADNWIGNNALLTSSQCN